MHSILLDCFITSYYEYQVFVVIFIDEWEIKFPFRRRQKSVLNKFIRLHKIEQKNLFALDKNFG